MRREIAAHSKKTGLKFTSQKVIDVLAWKLQSDLLQALNSTSIRCCIVPVSSQIFLLFQTVTSLIVIANQPKPDFVLTGEDAAGYQHDWS